jgi:hypothetical protein
LILKSPAPVIANHPNPAIAISCADFFHDSPLIYQRKRVREREERRGELITSK